ncbi:MAG: serine protein kinase PrkA [Bacteriovoracia bacterium]
MDTLGKIEKEIKIEFEKTNRILGYQEYLELLNKTPENSRLFTRSAAQYVMDMMDHYGREEVPNRPAVHYPTRFKLFEEQQRHKVVGLIDVQNEIYRSLQHFSKEGVNNKLILLHGPNGSAKSSLVQCLIRGMENYSELPQGALYRFNWIFPVDRITKGTLGLGAGYTGTKTTLDTFAMLNDEDVAAKIRCDLKDHPLLLIPKTARADFLPKSGSTSDYLVSGSPCYKCKQIFDSLLTAYKGDLKKVLMHVQVERFYISKRYRSGVVTIEPQMHVDAHSRQVTMDQSLAHLPASLQSLSLHELSGDLVDGNRGLVEYADLLKRPVDTFKYLLTACESGSVNIGSSIAYLDSVLIGSTNELQMDAFKEFPDFMSFKARIELIRVPYLLEVSEEKKIYDITIDKISGSKHVAPHTTFIGSLWSVLSRLKKPNAIHYPPNLTTLVGDLTPLQKAKLYDHGGMPQHLSAEERKLLRSAIRRLREEYSSVPYYEGRIGASAREMKTILYDAAHNQEFECLSPLSVFRELDHFVKRVTEYEFLKQDIKDGYHDNFAFISVVRNEYIAILDQEVRESMGVFDTKQYVEFLKKYILHLSHLIKKEKIKNPITGELENPDMSLIQEFEQIIEAPSGGSEREVFRNNVISAIGAYALDHPNQPVDYRFVFPDFIVKLENHYYNQQKSQMKQLSDAVLLFGTDKEDTTSDHYKLAKQTISTMISKFNYCNNCAKQSITFLIKSKY